jgi:lipopolysaccharide transport system ATP-binding protein
MSSNDIAISVTNLSKCYQIYEHPRDRLKQFVMPHLRRMTGQAPKQYFREFWALKDVSFEVKKGETVGIIGRNGSGKSTLLQMICGTLNPTSGSIQTNGRIAALLELGSGFNPEFTGRENIYLNGSIHGLSRDEIDDRYEKILEFSEIEDFIDQPLKIYSSGMAARLAFSAAIHSSPDVLIVDEALSVGDFQFQAKCFEKIKDLRESGVSIIMVSHDLSAIAQFSEKVLLINQGISTLYSDTVTAINEFKKQLTRPRENAKLPQLEKNIVVEKQIRSSFYKLSKLFHRSGSGDVEVIDWCLNSIDKSSPVATMEFGRPYEVIIKIESNRDGVDPNIGFFFTDSRGNEIAGCTINHEGCRTGTLKAGQVVLVSFRFKAILKSGTYLLNLGCSETINGNLLSYDRLYAMVEVVVTGKQDMIGNLHLFPEINLKVTL